MTHSDHAGSALDPLRGARALGVVVHGMARSGTSGVAGLFVASGYYAGQDDELLSPTTEIPPGNTRT